MCGLTRFGKPSTAITKRSCIVIVEVESDGDHQDLGMVVDSVSEVLSVDDLSMLSGVAAQDQK